MNRITVKRTDGYSVSDDYIEEAIRRLGMFEDAYEALLGERLRLPVDLENMRMQGKEKTVRYKETMAQKLINNNIILFFEKYGLKYVFK